MKRRGFVKTLTALTAVSALPAFGRNVHNAGNTKELPVVKPRKLREGDTVGLIAPGGFIKEEELKDSVKNLEALGFKVVFTDNILARYGYLAGRDEQRASDVNTMFGRKDVQGIVCARGGYGCARILPMLDYDVIRNNPKVIIGYSDITALLYGIYAKTGLAGFHGPVGISTFNEFSLGYFRSVLMSPSAPMTFVNATDEDPALESRKVYTIRGGKAQGQLAGGNLSIVVSLIGTPYDVDTRGRILFLEEIGEDPYRVDRMLTQMIEAGKFENAAGIALGVFHKCEPKETDSLSLSLNEVLFDRLYNLGIPVIYGMSFGHITNKFTLPFGINAALDVDNQTLSLLEPAVL